MFSDKSKHVINVVFAAVGIVSGLTGGVSFATLYSNEAAMVWAYYSSCMAFACLVVELLRYHGMLEVCSTPFTLWLISVYAFLSLATTTILFLVHISVGLRNRESVIGKSALDHSDFIVAVWTLLTAKYCLTLYFLAKKSRQTLLQQLSIIRAESPDFEALRYQDLDAEPLNSQAIGRRLRDAPDDHRRRRSSSDTRRARRADRRRRWSADRADLLSDVSPLPTTSQLGADTDSESAEDMEETAQRLTLDL